MNCKVDKAKISGKIVCPSNKSYTHRAVFLASLTKGESTIENILHSADTKATIEACKRFGAKINENGNNLVINSDSSIHASTIDAANSGTTIRIATAIASLADGKSTLSGDASLNQRPMKPLLDALESIGAKCSSNDGKPPVEVSGIIKGGELSILGNISSQFISALMIAAPLSQNGIVLNIEGDLVSKPYLDATISIMKKFGVDVKTEIPYKKYSINNQTYNSSSVIIPSDFSSLALLLSASILIGDNLQIEATLSDLPQGDEYFIEILKKLGADVDINGNIITVKSPEKLDGGKFDLSNTPDLLPPLSILALKTTNPIEIFNVKHARYKETDRIAILARELQKLGIKVEEKEDGLILHSSDELNGANLNSENDHRLFMTFCIAGMYVGNCIVSDAESVNVSYPNFIVDVNAIGGKIK
ncbi:MAG: 3-phosphoshikimate 1-carboxyvinyltransferase [Marine Group I thaumarchaeote]|nr:MAG: 3-phosphoshikimate 1-carboxyvinyltransferase [Marine Group I thaumarchaeote]